VKSKMPRLLIPALKVLAIAALAFALGFVSVTESGRPRLDTRAAAGPFRAFLTRLAPTRRRAQSRSTSTMRRLVS